MIPNKIWIDPAYNSGWCTGPFNLKQASDRKLEARVQGPYYHIPDKLTKRVISWFDDSSWTPKKDRQLLFELAMIIYDAK